MVKSTKGRSVLFPGERVLRPWYLARYDVMVTYLTILLSLLCKTKRPYLFTLKISRYCLLGLQSSIVTRRLKDPPTGAWISQPGDIHRPTQFHSKARIKQLNQIGSKQEYIQTNSWCKVLSKSSWDVSVECRNQVLCCLFRGLLYRSELSGFKLHELQVCHENIA